MPRILIVDDEPENLASLRRALGDENPDWEILVSKGEVEALAVLQTYVREGRPIDVLLTDLVMETEESGMRLLRGARTVDPLIMTILFTAKEKSLDRYAAFDVGAFDVVEKNIRGAAAGRELNIKTRAAVKYRAWAGRVSFMRRYFDPRVFELIEREPSLLDLRKRTLTVAFWDIRGFSRLCDILKAHPELIAGFLREYCDTASRVIFGQNGVLDKFVGDGVMALFGFFSREDLAAAQAIEAIDAAKEFGDRFDELARRWLERWQMYVPDEISIGLGCGIHTGEVLVGNVGTDFRDQFTALGPHVNFASRIEARAVGGQILISQSTRARVKGRVKLNAVGEITDLKNIAGKFAVYEVARKTGAA